MIMHKVSSKVVTNWACSFQLEVVLVSKCVHKLLGLVDCKSKIINVDCNVFVVITSRSHPDVWFSSAWKESFSTHTG